MSVNAQTTEIQKYEIEAGPLDSVLEEFSLQSGLNVSFLPEIVLGKQSLGLSGEYSATQAIQQILTNTEIEAQFTGNNSVSLVLTNETALIEPLRLAPIMVKGERVERTVFNTVSSVEVVTGESLDANPQISDVEDAIRSIANVLEVGRTPSGSITIRGQDTAGPVTGLGAFLGGQRPRATITLDGRPLSYGEYNFGLNSVWDLDAIEVFRGPQTTAQGTNSIAGAIYVRTRDPAFDFEASVRAEAKSRDGQRGSLMVNTPLSDSVAMRLTVDYEEQDSHIKFEDASFNPTQTGINEQTTARLKLLWEPSDNPELSTMLTVQSTEASGPSTESAGDPIEDLVSFVIGRLPIIDSTSEAVIHDISYEFSEGITFSNQLRFATYEDDFFDPLGFTQITDGQDLSNELLFTYSPSDNPLQFIVGASLQEIEEDSIAAGFLSINIDRTVESSGLFGELTYQISPHFDVTTGLRSQSDRIKQDFIIGTTVGSFNSPFDEWLPKIELGYEPSKDLRWSFQISRGYNPGGQSVSFTSLFGGPGGPPEVFVEYEPETAWNYEVAVRGLFLDGRLNLAANLFYMGFSDYQYGVTTIVPGTVIQEFIVRNAESAYSYGLETSADYAVNDRLTVSWSLGLLQTEVNDFTSDINGQVEGNEFIRAPDITATFGTDYLIAEQFSVGAQIRYVGEYFSTIDNDPGNIVETYTVADLRASYAINDFAELYAYVNNVFDLLDPTDTFVTGGSGRATLVTEPREIGLGIRVNF